MRRPVRCPALSTSAAILIYWLIIQIFTLPISSADSEDMADTELSISAQFEALGEDKEVAPALVDIIRIVLSLLKEEVLPNASVHISPYTVGKPITVMIEIPGELSIQQPISGLYKLFWFIRELPQKEDTELEKYWMKVLQLFEIYGDLNCDISQLPHYSINQYYTDTCSHEDSSKFY